MFVNAWASYGFWFKCITFLVCKKFTPVDPEFIIGKKTLRLLLQFGMQNLTPIELEFIVWRMTLRLLLIQFGAQKIYTCWSVEFIYDLEETLSLLLQWQLCMTEKGHNNALEKKGWKKSHLPYKSHLSPCLYAVNILCAEIFSWEIHLLDGTPNHTRIRNRRNDFQQSVTNANLELKPSGFKITVQPLSLIGMKTSSLTLYLWNCREISITTIWR